GDYSVEAAQKYISILGGIVDDNVLKEILGSKEALNALDAIVLRQGIQAKSILDVIANDAIFDSKYTREAFLKDLKKYINEYSLTDEDFENYLKLPGKFKIEGHHALCKFLGGFDEQELFGFPKEAHKAYHTLLAAELKKGGFPIPYGSRKGKREIWLQYFGENPGSQQLAFKIMIESAMEIDRHYTTDLFGYIKRNLINNRYEKFN
ncbi:MAG: hypothetical protein JXA77_04250, partial [Bacteroidales bacterium]|nr:hypothetical protein [Bacteroidales bacterium]